MKTWLTTFYVLIVFMAFTSCSRAKPPMPEGWSEPKAREVHAFQSWISYENGDWVGDCLSTVGDFDGNGMSDYAALLLNDAQEVGLFVWFRNSTGIWRISKVPINFYGATIDRLGIETVSPGSYLTACGKGYGDFACEGGVPDTMDLDKDGIDVFLVESMSRYLVWDVGQKSFKETLISD